MKDNFASLEEPKSKGPLVVLFAFGLMGTIFAYQLFNSPGHPIDGVVESVVAENSSQNGNSRIENVSVRLSDGTVVLAQVAQDRILQVGDEVRVMDRPTSGSGPAYEVIAKDHGTEP